MFILFFAGVLVLLLDTTAEDLPFNVRCTGCGRGRGGVPSFLLGGDRTSDFRKFGIRYRAPRVRLLALWVR